MSNKISIKPISELLGLNFFIPAYQRGYRWTKDQTTELLEDILEFVNKPNKKDNEWYCLQPIVVKRSFEKKEDNSSFLTELKKISLNDNGQTALMQTRKLIEEYERHRNWEVIDGQQRLTTVFLILKYLEQNPFEIEYETRKDSAYFLNGIVSKEESGSNTNIDYYHIYNSYTTIKKWFQTKAEQGQNSINSKFITPLLEKVKIIWYETNGDSIDIFTRINSGKIPLTNAELIKALFLNSSNFKDTDVEKLRLKQLEISSEWDRIEYALQEDSFWYFINKEERKLDTRIDFIFKLMYESAISEDLEVLDRKRLKIVSQEQIQARQKTHLTIEEQFGRDEYSTFRFFNDKFKNNSEVEVDENWQEIKKLYQTLEEWFNDRELYHKVGYLITTGVSIQDILKGNEITTKIEFKNWLDIQIAVVVKSKKTVDELEYGSDNSQLFNVLLLHNIMSTLKSEDGSLRFPFDKYKDKKNRTWSLEHIHAQKSDDISSIDDFEEWLKAIDSNILTEEIKAKINEFKMDKQESIIPQLVVEISNLFGESEIHSIENMALLSKNDNSKLNNGLFPVKRERIIELEKNGAFIPLATKKVFQKYYKGCTKQLSKWEENDRQSYLNDIKDTLTTYLHRNEQ